MPDGTSNVLLQGVRRVRYTGFVPGASYPVAAIEPLDTTPAPDGETTKLVAKIGRMATLRAAAGKAVPKPLLQALTEVNDPEMLGDLVSFTLLTSLREKQQLLEMLDLRLRLQKLLRCLENQSRKAKVQKQLKPTKTDHGFGVN